jgi:hypothetical protein
MLLLGLDAFAALQLPSLLHFFLTAGDVAPDLEASIASPSIRTVPKTPVETDVSAKAVSEQESDPAGAMSEIATGRSHGFRLFRDTSGRR